MNLRAVVDEVEAAKDAMTGTVPSTRSAGTPLAEGIHELEQRLAAAQELMPAWRHPDLEDEWLACDAGIRNLSSEPDGFGRIPRSSAASKG